jgi:isoquinoline 1-oxidoreductase beta subunit
MSDKNVNKNVKKTHRRRFLLGGLGIAGALVVGWGVLPPRQRLTGSASLPLINGQIALNGWVVIAPDGRVTVMMAKSEMGQGVMTALPMLVAEELDVPLAMVDIAQAPIDKIYGDATMLADGLPFHPDDTGIVKRTAQWLAKKGARELGVIATGGSSSMKDSWLPLRQAGAAARARLLSAAAQQWQVPLAECRTQAGMVLHDSGKRATYGELVARAAAGGQPAFQLKEPAQFSLIGHAQARRDSPAKINGSAQFGLDVRPAGLLYAAVSMSPTLGGTLKSFDQTVVSGMPGVVKILSLPSHQSGMPATVTVVAHSWWQAKQAVAHLPMDWDAGVNGKLSSASIAAQMRESLQQDAGFTYHRQGDMTLAQAAAKTLKAEYSAPYLAHAALEPINCTAQFREGRLTLWVSTQVPSVAVTAAARAAGIDEREVTLHVPFLGGGFGRRLEIDMVTQAVLIARQTQGAPVQVIWRREDDMTNDFYRPAAMARFEAAISANGEVLTYESKSVSAAPVQQLLQRAFGLPAVGPDKTAIEGLFDLCYEFPNQQMAHVIVDSVVPVGSWRSVGHSHNAFFKESFIDEVAHASGKDSLTLRRSLLKNHPRHLAVLNAAVERAGQPAAGCALGIALHQSFGSIVAEVAEVSVQAGQIRVHKMTCAVDCGLVVNPDGVRQQVESAVMDGLSAALLGEITIRDGQVEQKNFHQYRMLRMHQAPVIDVVIMPGGEHPEGIGEPALPPAAPAVANAVFALTGQRLRSLPLRLRLDAGVH